METIKVTVEAATLDVEVSAPILAVTLEAAEMDATIEP